MQAFLPTDNSTEANFFRCKGERNYVNYIDRINAQDVPDDIKTAYNNMVDITGKHPDASYIDYANNRHGSTGLFNLDGFMSKSKIEQAQKELAKSDSILWVGVISFTPEMASKICDNKTEAQALISNHFPKLIEGSHLDIDNLNVMGAYHTNTDNPHIHLIFHEKNPTHINKDGSLAHSRKLVLPKKNFDNFKYAIAQETLQKNYGFSSLRNPIKESLRVNIANDKFHLSNLVALSKDIIKEGHFQYARLSSDNKRTVDGLVQYALKNSPDTLTLYETYRKNVLKTQTDFFKIAKENNLKPSVKAKNFYSNRMNDLNERLGNTVLKVIKSEFLRQQKKAVALQQFSGNKKSIASGKFIKLSNSFDLSNGEFKKIMNKLVKDFQENVHGQSVESFKLEKKLKGENLIFDEQEDRG